MNLDNTHFGGEVKKFFDLPIFNRVRCSDPITSYEAADAAKDLATKHLSIIVIEEIAQEVEKMQGFGKDTIDSLTVYIRKMKQ